jgi:hypothetical protein
MWRRSIVVVGVLVLTLVGLAVPVAAKVGFGFEVEGSTHVEVGEPFSLRLVPLDCDGCPTFADVADLPMRAVTGEGRVVWEGRVSPQLTLDGIVLGEDDVQVDSATWLTVTLPYEAFLGLFTDAEAGAEPPPEFVSVGRVAVLGTPTEDNMTTLIVAVGVFFVVAVAGLLVRRSARSRPPSEGAPDESPVTS